MKTIQATSKGMAYLIKVDDSDYENVSRFKWSIKQERDGLYAVRNTLKKDGKKRIYMHHEIVGKPPLGMVIDHKDCDGLNNQRSNLRFATKSQNGANRGYEIRNTSGFKGVSWDVKRDKWQVGIQINKHRFALGRFTDINDAARAYDAAARKHFGEFANLNFKEAKSKA